jgi:hypothetical protein
MVGESSSPSERCRVFEEGPRALRIDALYVGYEDEVIGEGMQDWVLTPKQDVATTHKLAIHV